MSDLPLAERYPMTVNKLADILGDIKAAGMGDMLVVLAFGEGAPMPIDAILNPPVGTRERYGDYLMSEEQAATAPEDAPQVICLRAPMMTPCGWLSRELKHTREVGGE